jgi:methylmalonyl-CoA mutase N-terminal domain/subunit
MERGCWEYFERLDSMGGMVAAIEQNYPQQEVRKASSEYQEAIERKERIIVGVNDFVVSGDPLVEMQPVGRPLSARQTPRDPAGIRMTLDKMREAATADGVNIMPSILECVRAYANLDEMCGELRAAYGAHKE